jgi:hypothetical protein
MHAPGEGTRPTAPWLLLNEPVLSSLVEAKGERADTFFFRSWPFQPQRGDPRQPGASPRGSVTESDRSPERAAQDHGASFSVAWFGTFRFARIRSLLCGFEAWRLFPSVPLLWTERVGKAAKPQSRKEGGNGAFRPLCAPAPLRENHVSGFRRKGTCLAQRRGGAEGDGTANGRVFLRLLAADPVPDRVVLD